jgi:very-short-patch-repair endonuclease
MPRDPILVELARKLRHDMTPAEQILWRELRGRRFQGWKFRRQHIVGRFIADFYCPTIQLVIELDGETHIGKEERDRERQDELEGMGITVLRFWNPDIYDDREAVLEMIFRVCMALSGGRADG